MTAENCPTRETLELLLVGKLAPADREFWGQHLLQCEQCVAAAETFSAEDDFTSAMQAQQYAECEDQEVLDHVIERCKQLGSDQETVPAGETVLVGNPPPAETSPVDHKKFDPQDIDFLQPSQQDDEIGRLGGYRVFEVLGVGGMGIVFRAEDPHLRRQVALKVLKPCVAASKSAKERFLKEAQATAAIEHDHIVTIHQVGEDHGIPFIAMRYLRGESLQSRLEREGQLAQDEAVRIGRQIALGLAAAHKTGLIHRDIKPDNIWLDSRQGRVKIVDFGLVRSNSEDSGLTQSGVIVGTPKYMAPEQAEGKFVDHRSDLFSLGSVLYHAITGTAPFQADNLTATLLAVAQADPLPVEKLRPDVDGRLAALIRKLLSKSPADRVQAASDVAEALAEIDEQLTASNCTVANVAPVPGDQSLQVQHVTKRHETQGRKSADGAPVVAVKNETFQKSSHRLRLAVLCGAILAGIIFVVTKRGTVTIDIADKLSDEVQVEILEGGESVTVMDKANNWTARLAGGRYELQLAGGGDEFSLKGTTLNVSRFGRSIVEMKYHPNREKQKSEEVERSSIPTRDLDPEVYEHDRAVAEKVLLTGGSVRVASPVTTDQLVPENTDDLPEWPLKLTQVRLNSSVATNEDVKSLSNLPWLDQLQIVDSKINADGLSQLTDCPKLTGILLHGTEIRGVDLEVFGNFPSLQVVYVGVDQIENWNFLSVNPSINEVRLQRSGDLPSVLKQLGVVPHLWLLELPVDNLNDTLRKLVVELKQRNPQLHVFTRNEVVGISPAADSISTLVEREWKLPGEGFDGGWSANPTNTDDVNRLVCVRRAGSRFGMTITEEDCRALLKTSPSYWTFSATATHNTGRLINALADGPAIGQIFLVNSDLSDKDLESLSRIRNLCLVNVSGTNVTEAGIAACYRRMPGCQIISDFGVFPAVPDSQVSRE